MNVVILTTGQKYYGEVNDGGFYPLYRSKGYYTKGMALADAKCWLAFHGGKVADEVMMVWVPIDQGDEVELPYADVQRIALEYQTVRSLARQGEQYASHRALRPLLNWAREEHGLSTRDMAQITNWWWDVDSKTRVERSRKAVEDTERKQQR